MSRVLTGGTDNEAAELVKAIDRNAVIEYLFDGLSITDTSAHVGDAINLSAYRSIQIFAFHSLDQTPSIGFKAETPAGSSVPLWYESDAAAWEASQNAPVALSNANSLYALTSSPNYAWIRDGGIYKLSGFAKCSTAPTSGSVTVFAVGLPNC